MHEYDCGNDGSKAPTGAHNRKFGTGALQRAAEFVPSKHGPFTQNTDHDGMNVLLIMNAKGVGGAELQFIELANHLSRSHEVTLVCMQSGRVAESGSIAKNIKLREFAYASKVQSVSEILKAIKYCRKAGPDIIVSTSFIGDLVGAAARMSEKQRLISLQTVSAPKSYPRLDALALKRFDVLVAGCNDIANFLREEGHENDRINVVNNWVDFSQRVATKEQSLVRTQYGLGENGILIGCIGRLHPQKGQEFLIRAFKDLSVRHPDAKLVLVGDGPLAEEMRREAGGSSQIIFTGTVTGPDYNNLLSVFDIYVQPSRYEGLPRTLLDAMYMGLPIIATAANGMADIVRDGENGYLVPIGDEKAILAALERLIDDPEAAERLGKQAALDAREGYAMESQMAQLDELLVS